MDEKSKKKDLPISIDKEHRKVMDALLDTISAIRSYRTSFQECSEQNIEKCKEFMNKCDKIDISTVDIYNADDIYWSVDKKVRKSSAEIKVFKELKLKHVDFSNLIHLYRRLKRCVKLHLYRYCLSLHDILPEVKVDIVPKYEEAIVSLRGSIDQYLKKAKAAADGYKGKTNNFGEWLAEYAEVKSFEDEFCSSLLKMQEFIREYIKADQQYPIELYHAMIKRCSEREKKLKRKSKIAKSKDANDTDVVRKSREVDECRQHLQQLKTQAKKVKNSKEILALKIKKEEKEVKEKLKVFEETQSIRDKFETKVKPKDYNEEATLRQYNFYKNKTQDCKIHYEKSVDGLKASRRQIKRFESQDIDFKGKIYEAEVNLEEADNEQKTASAVIDKDQCENEKLDTRIEVLNSEIAYVQAMREYKLSPDTLRRIHKTGDYKFKVNEEQVMFINACHVISESIGDDWKRLYIQLPFSPRREKVRKRQDLERQVAIYGSPRYDLTDKDQANHSLRKWKEFNPRASVTDLVGCLKKIEKEDLANDVEQILCGQDN